MITRKFVINTSNNSASSTQSIILYKGDSGLLLNLEIKNFKFNIDDVERVDTIVINKENIEDFKIFVDTYHKEETDEKNKGKNILTVILPVGKDGFEAKSEGIYNVQLHLFDVYGNRVSVPVFNIEVRDTIY